MASICNELLDEAFDDVHLMVARAKKHEAEFHAAADMGGARPWWDLEEIQRSDGTFANTLVIRCAQLRALKPIAADLCNNLVHALDQMIGALTRLQGRDNADRLQFPWRSDDADFERELSRVEQAIGNGACASMREAREECRLQLPHAMMAKKLSNSGKHWELVPSSAAVAAVAVHRPSGEQLIFDLPPRALEEQLYYTFYEGSERLSDHPMSVLLGLRFSGLGEQIAAPESVFGSAFHYVETTIAKVSACDDVQALVSEGR